jgi:hypothetical protein
MRHLIACCDGTWDTSNQESVTNVKRLHDALADKDDSGNEQRSNYFPGVGTEGGLVARLTGGGQGVGLDGNIMRAYQWLTTEYEPGDRIAVFGFSRGAYTVRSLAGMIAACGLIDTTGMDAQQTWHLIEKVYRNRYQRGAKADPAWRDGLAFSYDPDDAQNIPVRFVGVWDTVGALGIPDNLSWLKPLDPASLYTFHDVKLNPHIPHARHAVAMDEHRRAFTPTLWTTPAQGQDVEQKWFPGSHMDVGGGHLQTGLSDGALRWMIDEASAAAGLTFHKTTLNQIRPDPLDVLHDDNEALLAPAFQLVLEPMLDSLSEFVWDVRPRAVPMVDRDVSQDKLDRSVYERHDGVPITSGPYRPTDVLEPGQSKIVEISAAAPWNETGLYLRAGDYIFAARGEWEDNDIWSGPGGTRGAGRFSPRAFPRTLLSAIGEVEKLYRRLPAKKEAYLPLARREVNAPWMSLVGVVANDAIAVNASRAHEHIAIGGRDEHHVIKDGYFYAFANDAWGSYGNNHGSVHLEVTRTR